MEVDQGLKRIQAKNGSQSKGSERRVGSRW